MDWAGFFSIRICSIVLDKLIGDLSDLRNWTRTAYTLEQRTRSPPSKVSFAQILLTDRPALCVSQSKRIVVAHPASTAANSNEQHNTEKNRLQYSINKRTPCAYLDVYSIVPMNERSCALVCNLRLCVACTQIRTKSSRILLNEFNATSRNACLLAYRLTRYMLRSLSHSGLG